MEPFGPQSNERTLHPGTGVATACPRCRGGEVYLLADGRQQCRRCRKKYTPEPVRTKLSPATREALARSFWHMVPADQAALSLEINRKTVQRHYATLRLAIAREEEVEFTRRFGFPSAVNGQLPGERDEGPKTPFACFPLFWVTCQDRRIHAVFPGTRREDFILQAAHRLPLVLIFSRHRLDVERLLIDRFQQKRLGAAGPPAPHHLRSFWPWSREHLRRYRGGFKRNFPLFIQEMAFRFSHQEEKEVPAFLRLPTADGSTSTPPRNEGEGR